MDNFTKNSNREVIGFLDQWKKHPMSIPIIVLLVTSTFLLVLVQGELNDNKILLACIFCGFSMILFLVVVAVLIWRKFVFYNATELVILEVDRYIRNIQESLADVEIGYGMAFDHLRAPAIRVEVSNSIQNFEMLNNLLKHIDYNLDGNDLTKKALAKYYFRNKKYQKGLEWIEKVKDKKDSEFNFIKGLLLWKLEKDDESRECFNKSTHANATYYKYLTYLTASNPMNSELDKFITEATKETSPLYTNFFAQLNVSSAYIKKAFNFPEEGKAVDVSMLKRAIENSERLLMRDDNGFAYYNSACYISRMGKLKEDLDPERKFDANLYCSIIIDYLDKALTIEESFVKYAVNDNDLEWTKEIAGNKYYELIGRHYEKYNKDK